MGKVVFDSYGSLHKLPNYNFDTENYKHDFTMWNHLCSIVLVHKTMHMAQYSDSMK